MSRDDFSEETKLALAKVDSEVLNTLQSMDSVEDWTVDCEREETMMEALHQMCKKYDIDAIKPTDPVIAAKILGWVSASKCIGIIHSLSEHHPQFASDILKAECNDKIGMVFIERVAVLEKMTLLKRLFDPQTMQSINQALKNMRYAIRDA